MFILVRANSVKSQPTNIVGRFLLSCFSSTFLLLSLPLKSSQAQVIPDRTLGSESSVVTPQATQSLITGGAARGNNLFHSFQQFNINSGITVRFNPPGNTTNIFGRVTGVTPSNIQGTLGVLGDANLFLLNPNGILFGPNAQLDLSGSFAASTANRFQFGTAEFSAVTTNPAPLLTISVPIGMQYGENAPDRLIRNEANLTLTPQQQLTFDAGTIEQAGTITIPNGIVELRSPSLSLTGQINTSAVDEQTGILRLISPADLTIQTTGSLKNQAISRVLQNNQVVIQADRDLNIIGAISSDRPNPLTLTAGNNLNLISDGSGPLKLAGNTALRSGGNLRIDNSLFLTTQLSNPRLILQSTGDIFINPTPNQDFKIVRLTGQRGTLAIQANTLDIQRGAVQTFPVNSGIQGPRLTVTTSQDISLQDVSSLATYGNSDQTTADIRIQVGRFLKVLDNSSIGGLTQANVTAANAGNIDIQADTILLRPRSIQDQSSIISQSSAGNAGNIILTARQLLLDGSQAQAFIGATTERGSFGNAGNITLNATESIELIGNRPGEFIFPSQGSFSFRDVLNEGFGRTTIQASAFGSGASGTIQVNTDRLLLKNGVLLANAAGLFDNRGTAGDVLINANDISLSGLAVIASGTVGPPDAGNIEIRSRRIQLDRGAGIGVSTVGLENRPPSGDAGDLNITTDILNITGGSVIAANTENGGAGGTLTVNAKSVNITGSSTDGSFSSSLLTDASEGAQGKGGELRIQTDRLQVLNGGQIRASTRGAQDAGNLKITANQITVSGINQTGSPSTLEAQSTGSGRAGELDVTANKLIIRDRAQGTTQSLQGSGGNINLVLRDLLLLRRAGKISSTAGIDGFGGDGGNINIQAGAIIASPRENTDITANAFGGKGGNITIQTNALIGLRPQSRLTGQSDITASSTLGIDGNISIDLLAPTPAPDVKELPVQLLESDQKISTVCHSLTASRFIISGRGGIPIDPRQQLAATAILQDWRNHPPNAIQSSPQATLLRPSQPMIEAQTWSKTTQGKVHLIANTLPMMATSITTKCENLSDKKP